MQTVLTRAEIEAHDPEGGKGGRWLCPLPACQSHTDVPHHRSLDLEDNGLWRCHRCGAGGQIKDKWKPFEPKSTKERKREEGIRQRVGLAKILAKVAQGDDVAPVTPDRYRLGTLGCLQASPAALAYLEGRGFKGEEAIELLSSSGVRFAPDFGRRLATETVKESRGTASVVFPLRDDQKRLVASQGRFLKPWEREGKTVQKFLTLGDKDAGVFATCGALEALQKGFPVAIVEAPFDALSLALAGLPALALCGSSGVPEWLTRKAFGRRFLMAFDADKTGDSAAERLGAELSLLGGVVERLRPEGAKDWNELLQTAGAESLRALLAREDEAPYVHEEPLLPESLPLALDKKSPGFPSVLDKEKSSQRLETSSPNNAPPNEDDFPVVQGQQGIAAELYAPEVQTVLSAAWGAVQDGSLIAREWQRSPGCLVSDPSAWLAKRAGEIERLREALGESEDWTATPRGKQLAQDLIEFARWYEGA